MVKFIILTRGRTGSSAVNNELSKIDGFCVMEELFLRWNYDKSFEVYPKIMPFDKWKSKFWWKSLGWIGLDGLFVRDYFDEIEGFARETDNSCFGFKVLSHHFKERKYLRNALKQRGYKVIYLKRNIARQVISGMVANKRGKFNSKVAIDDERSFNIDLNEFKKLVKSEMICVKKDLRMLKRKKFDYCVVTYEDFCENRDSFYSKISDHLDIDLNTPEVTDYKVMIKDLAKTLYNYNDVKECSLSLGYEI